VQGDLRPVHVARIVRPRGVRFLVVSLSHAIQANDSVSIRSPASLRPRGVKRGNRKTCPARRTPYIEKTEKYIISCYWRCIFMWNPGRMQGKPLKIRQVPDPKRPAPPGAAEGNDRPSGGFARSRQRLPGGAAGERQPSRARRRQGLRGHPRRDTGARPLAGETGSPPAPRPPAGTPPRHARTPKSDAGSQRS
jgi:hypothetical protein